MSVRGLRELPSVSRGVVKCQSRGVGWEHRLWELWEHPVLSVGVLSVGQWEHPNVGQ